MMLIDCYVLIISELTAYVLHGADFKVETFFISFCAFATNDKTFFLSFNLLAVTLDLSCINNFCHL